MRNSRKLSRMDSDVAPHGKDQNEIIIIIIGIVVVASN